jgi:serine/threonine-protein kinase
MLETRDFSSVEQVREGLAPGSMLEGHYTVVRELGRGGMGVVYLAEDSNLRRRVGIKVLVPRRGREASDLLRFRKEAQALAQIRHPSVVQVFSLGQLGELAYFVMEYVEGETLSALLGMEQTRGSYLPIDVVIGILTQVCDALGEVHRRGIVHHDVKPLNIMVTREYHAILMDFGLARDPREGEHHFAGTIYYVAPEECARKPLEPERAYLTDIYSLGAVAYELLTGRPPFVGDNAMQILWQHLEAQPIPPSELRPEISSALDNVVLSALSKDAAGRPLNCKAFKAALLEARQVASSPLPEPPFSLGVSGVPAVTDAPLGVHRVQQVLEAGPCVLIVDSDPEVRAQLAECVRDVWSRVRTVESDDGLAAFELSGRLRPDLVLTDLALPHMNGLELCAALGAQEETQQIPVVIVTGVGDPAERELVQALGAREIIDKPLELAIVRPLLESILGRRRATRA